MRDRPSQELLECVVGQTVVGVPRASVAQVIDYELAPLPLSAPYVGGLGVHRDQILVSIALTPILGNARRSTRGVLLETPGSTCSWIIEVTRVTGFITIDPAEAAPRSADAPPWIGRVSTRDGRSMIAIDVTRMVALLSEETPSA